MARAPTSLTAAPAPDIVWGEDDVPRSSTFDDVYYSVGGGLEETREVFLKGCALPETWAGRDVFTIGELGFGTGLNFLAVWQLWRKTREPGARLHFISVEQYPVSPRPKGEITSDTEIEALAAKLQARWPGRVKGHHRIELDDGVTLTLCHDEVLPALQNLNRPAQAWFLDGFSPSKNPDMWSEGVMMEIGRLSEPGTRAATFTVAGHVRRSLAAAGFDVEKKPGFGKKRERLEAIFKGAAASTPKAPKTIAIIGGGIAGASLCRAFAMRGLAPVLIHDDPDYERAASGNPAALVMPRLDLQDRPESRFFLSAYLFALHVYGHSGAVLSVGAQHVPKTQRDAARYDKLLAQAALPAPHLSPALKGLQYDSALTLEPRRILAKWTKLANIINRRAAALVQDKDGWRILDQTGALITQADAVIIAAGAGLVKLSDLEIEPSRGQVSLGEMSAALEQPLVYGGYVLPLGGGILAGATHLPTDDKDPYETREQDHIHILEQLAEIDPALASAVKIESGRSSVRATTYDRLPAVGPLAEGGSAIRTFEGGQQNRPYIPPYILGGLGSHGFLSSPLLAEHIVCELMGEASPLPLDAQAALSSQRLLRHSRPPISKSP